MARILLAEDEDSLRELVARALKQDGHDVVSNCDGAAALEALVRDEGRYDLLLTDIKMPIMDGIALALSVTRDYPNVSILLMTGYADQRERASGLEGLVQGIIAKPFTLAELRFAVAAALVK
jgi:two-component system cell cycle response regulator CpdR